MFQLLPIAFCSVTIHFSDQSVSVFSAPAIRWIAVDCGKLCCCPDQKQTNKQTSPKNNNNEITADSSDTERKVQSWLSTRKLTDHYTSLLKVEQAHSL